MFLPILIIGGTAVGIVCYLYSIGKNSIDKQELSFPNKRLSFTEFIEDLSDMADHYMISESQKNSIVYISGDCKIHRNSDDPNIIFVDLIIYGKDSMEKWHKSSINHKRHIKYFSDDSNTKVSLKKLLSEPLTFKVTPPKKEENKLC